LVRTPSEPTPTLFIVDAFGAGYLGGDTSELERA